MSNFYEKIREALSLWFEGLSNRERRLLGILAGISAAVVVVGLLVVAVKDLRGKNDRLFRSEENFSEIKKLEGPYRIAKMKQEDEWLRIRMNDVSLYTLLPTVAARLGLQIKDLQEKKQVLPNAKVTEISVNVSLTKLSIDKLTALIEGIETAVEGGLVKVTKIKINTRFDEPDLLDLQMTVSTWKVS